MKFLELKPVLVLTCSALFFVISLYHYVEQSKHQFRLQRERILSHYAPDSIEWKRMFAVLSAYENNASQYVFYHTGALPSAPVDHNSSGHEGEK